MNLVNIIGQIEGDAEVAYTSKDGSKKLYKFIVKVPKPFKSKAGREHEDFINIKAWSTAVKDEYALHDQAIVGIEARVQSFGNAESTHYGNEIVANRIIYLN
ncbi:single-stranded DNA-binding protein [Mesoplasma seiffertii]|uniref:single-stranded DNA-binding protein n=1 Tax=Mesoplasma seiffertii TaxID=28224 RepID=UPI00047DACAF|nr:single-stranded DNA-binding protein [Mesoplasma seiffertii]